MSSATSTLVTLYQKEISRGVVDILYSFGLTQGQILSGVGIIFFILCLKDIKVIRRNGNLRRWLLSLIIKPSSIKEALFTRKMIVAEEFRRDVMFSLIGGTTISAILGLLATLYFPKALDFSLLLGLIISIVNILVATVKRNRDTGNNGILSVLILVPGVNIIYFVYLAFRKTGEKITRARILGEDI